MTDTKSKSTIFAEYVASVKDRMGAEKKDAPTIADAVLKDVFPKTSAQAKRENGAFTHFRAGVTQAVSRLIKDRGEELATDQLHFADDHPDLFPYVDVLQRSHYYILSSKAYLSLQEVLSDRRLVDEAADYLEAHAADTMKEVRSLRALSKAMKAKGL